MILSAKQLCKKFSSPHTVELLRGIDLQIAAGESIAITGRSGEGKTTLLHILGTLEPFDSGKLIIAGKPIESVNSAQLRNQFLGFVFQSFNLLEDFSVLDNVLMPARIARTNPSPEHGLRLLAKVGLEQRADFPAKLLSGGERQRAAIARALCNSPKILFADEPTGNLDRAHATAIGQLLFDIAHTENMTLILVTHDQELAGRCHRTYALSNGILVG